MESLQIMAAANEISVDAALAALKVFEVEKMFSLKSRPALVRDEIDAVVHCSSPRGSTSSEASLSCCYAAKLAVKNLIGLL